ncbi:acetyl-coenzyme A synthetase N-terminal domain-containing protein [Piscibacillus salipiscarius]|uniref:acetyl-coenzyme A synthetase N-terminal domain-containing protein n=1 Tax=Piscibacillus salipiscarius TaxID=299480 RepID=UPI0034E1BF0A
MQQSGYSNYDDYYKHTIKDISSFWDQAVKALDIQWYQDYDEVVNLDKGIMYPEWFVNGKMNVAHNALDKWASDSSIKNENALIWESDDGSVVKYTFKRASG